jgi:hypothetical protein
MKEDIRAASPGRSPRDQRWAEAPTNSIVAELMRASRMANVLPLSRLMLGHADIKQTQRYLNITDEELRKAMTGVWERRRQLRAVSQ